MELLTRMNLCERRERERQRERERVYLGCMTEFTQARSFLATPQAKADTPSRQ
jgi:hypothetical protein